MKESRISFGGVEFIKIIKPEYFEEIMNTIADAQPLKDSQNYI